MATRILLVDDQAAHRQMVRDALQGTGDYEFREAASGAEAIRLARQEEPDLVLLDWKLPDIDGIDVIHRLRVLFPYLVIIMITGYEEPGLIGRALKEGAYDFVAKSVDFHEMLPLRVERAVVAIRERSHYRREAAAKYHPDGIVGGSAAMLAVRTLLAKVAPTTASVLVQGESGTGKELVARAIHYTSLRANKPFVDVNCAAIAEGLLESELFGHVKGAFTGAIRDKEGEFELADEGTIFLDEVGDMSPALQAKVLRVLQEQSFTKVGGKSRVTVDVRVIAATNKDLQKELSAGRFREDLFYRLNVVTITLPPLRDRGDDIILLAKHFIERFNAEIKKSIRGLTDAATEMLRKYSFPGNIRQLSSIVERAIILADDQAELIDVEDLPPEVRFGAPASCEQQYGQMTHEDAKTAFEKQYLVALLARADGNISEAARLADLNRSSLKEKLDKYGISPH